MSTKMDANQVIKTVFDEVTGALKTTPASATSFAIELSQADGDSVQTFPNNLQYSLAGVSNTSDALVGAEFSLVGMKSINLFAKTATTVTDPQVLTLQISPTDTGDVWISTTLTITPSGTAGTVVMGTPLTALVARRGRVRTAAAITSGTYDLHVVAEAV